MTDPTESDPDKYKVIFENDEVRVLEYKDQPGARTSPHQHPNSVMYPLSTFRRKLISATGESVEVEIKSGELRWVPAQTHSGENIGDTESHSIFVELKTSRITPGEAPLGPSQPGSSS